LFLGVAVPTSLPSGWRRHTKFRLTLVNQLSDKLSQSKLNGKNLLPLLALQEFLSNFFYYYFFLCVIDFTELEQWFDEKTTNWGLPSMCPLNEIHAKDSGFLLNGELKIVVEIKVLETIGKLDVTEETSTITETVDVNGFQLLPSQVRK